MRTRWISGVGGLAAVATLLVTPSAQAEVVNLPPHQRTVTTDDGWQVIVGHRDETMNKVPPLTMAGTTREAFVTNHAYASFAGHGVGRPESGVLQTGYQIGCFTQLHAVTPGIGGQAGISPQIQVSPGSVGVGIGPSISVNPTITANVAPGQVGNVTLGEKQIQGPVAGVTVREAHISVDGCLGPVTVRSWTRFAFSTSLNDDSNIVYGDPTNL